MSKFKYIWRDPSPIEGNDYRISHPSIQELIRIKRREGEDYIVTIQYNNGMSEAEVTANEIQSIHEYVAELVDNFETDHEIGFTPLEIAQLKEGLPEGDEKAYQDAMMGNTCGVVNNITRMYHCDVRTALRCQLEEREIKLSEWD